MTTDRLQIDLNDLAVEEIQILVQEGSRGLAEFAASCCKNCNCGTCSCGQQESSGALGGSGSLFG